MCLKKPFGNPPAQPCCPYIPRCPPEARPLSHFLNGLFCAAVSADSLSPSSQVWMSCFVPISDTASSWVCREGLGNDSNQTLQIRSRQRLVALAKESNYFFLWLAVRSDTTYIKFFTVYPEPLRIVICCQSASGEPVNLSRFPSS